MPRQEEQKFLDLDLVTHQIPDVNDRDLFQEAVKCYYAGSHRAAVILAWYAVANCLKRRIFQLQSEGDGEAQKVADGLTPPNGGDAQVGEEKALLVGVRDCDLIDDFEYKSLCFAREMRNKCAHPTGFVPSAEAVRYVLYICSQYVLSSTGYRGMAYIKDLVTTQLDDVNFLSEDGLSHTYCQELIQRVPKRLCPQFIKIAAQERGRSHTDVWRANAHIFFGHLLQFADDSLIPELTGSVQMFEAVAPDFFATLVGLEPRTARAFGQQKRLQIRRRLRNSTASAMRPDEIHAWAVICAEDGFEAADRDLLHEKFPAMARHIKIENDFLSKRRKDIVELISVLLQSDSTSTMAAGGCIHLFPTNTFDQIESSSEEETEAWKDAISSIITQVISRFIRDDKHRALISKVRTWNSTLLMELLRSATTFWRECSEDFPEDVNILFDARDELRNRYSAVVPPTFYVTLRHIWEGRLLPEWHTEESEAGGIFRSRVSEADLDEAMASTQEVIDSTGVSDISWEDRLGVNVSPFQDHILRLIGSNGPVTNDRVAELLGVSVDDAQPGLDYLTIQGLLLRKDELFILRDDIKDMIAANPEASDN